MKNTSIICILLFLFSTVCFAQSSPKKLSRKERKKIEKIEKFEALKQSLQEGVFSFTPRYQTTANGYRSRSKGYLTMSGVKGTVELSSGAYDHTLYLETGFNTLNYKYTEVDQGNTLVVTFDLKFRSVLFQFSIKSTIDRTVITRTSSDRGATSYEGKLLAR